MNTMFSKKSVHWKTPQRIYELLDDEFNFTFDPCPLNSYFNGLTLKWSGNVFINPPFNLTDRFLSKSVEERTNCNVIVLLIASRTDTIYWHEFAMKANEIRFIKGRLHFNNSINTAPFPSCIIIFKPKQIDNFDPIISSFIVT